MTAGGPLATTGKVAVLVDGLTYSAEDFFAYGARHFSDALVVGRPSAGAYGCGGNAAPRSAEESSHADAVVSRRATAHEMMRR